MTEVDEALERFAADIKNSEVYREYRKQLDLVKQDPALKARIDEFRQRNYEMQMSEGFDFAKLAEFEKEFKGFRENPLVDNFLAAELAFCRMMQELEDNLIERLDFE